MSRHLRHMKTVLVLINLSGLFLYVDSVCDLSACSPPSTTEQTCSDSQTYIDCLKSEESGCTSSQSATEDAFNLMIRTLEDSLNCTHSGPDCDAGACVLSASVSCSAYETYLTCLNGEKAKCSSSDTVNPGLIDTAITTTAAAQAALQCSSVVPAESLCDSTKCNPPSATEQSCSNIKTYVDCLNAAVKGCTGDLASNAMKTAMDTTITAASEALKKCGGTMVTTSASTLILSLLAFYLAQYQESS